MQLHENFFSGILKNVMQLQFQDLIVLEFKM